MRYITNVALLIKGDRVPKGTEIELAEEEVAHIDPADISPVGEAPVETTEDAAPVELADMTLAQLKDKAKEFGLAPSGTKADLLERIQLHASGQGESEQGEGDYKPE